MFVNLFINKKNVYIHKNYFFRLFRFLLLRIGNCQENLLTLHHLNSQNIDLYVQSQGYIFYGTM